MKVKLKNSSSKKTRDKIKLAFATLLNEKKELNKVSVTDIVKLIDITRASFYTHYDNIYDVAKDIENDTLNILYNNINEGANISNIDNFFNEIIEYLKQNENMYRMLLSSNDPLIYTIELHKVITQTVKEALNGKNIEDLDLNVSLFIDGCMAIIIKYFRNNVTYTLEDINNFMHKTFKKLFY